MSPERTKLILQVAKLRAMATGSPHKGEARSFAAAAKRVQKKHRITEEEIAGAQEERFNLTPLNAEPWKKYLADMCCTAGGLLLCFDRTHCYVRGRDGRAYASYRLFADWMPLVENIAVRIYGRVWRSSFHDALCLGIIQGMEAAQQMAKEAALHRASKPTRHAREQQVPPSVPDGADPAPSSTNAGPDRQLPPSADAEAAFQTEIAAIERAVQSYNHAAIALGRDIGFGIRFGTLRLLESSRCSPPSQPSRSSEFSTPGAPRSRLLCQAPDGSFVPISSKPSYSTASSTSSAW